ncbi:MAG: hypothetical protein IRD7MM_06430 [Candidatus Midichloria mitochondrii]
MSLSKRVAQNPSDAEDNTQALPQETSPKVEPNA